MVVNVHHQHYLDHCPVCPNRVNFPHLRNSFSVLAFIFRVKKQIDMPMPRRLSLGSFRRPVIQERNVHPSFSHKYIRAGR